MPGIRMKLVSWARCAFQFETMAIEPVALALKDFFLEAIKFCFRGLAQETST